MARSGGKYQVNDHWFMRRSYKGLHENEEVILTKVYMKGRKTFMDVHNIDGKEVKRISFRMLKKAQG
ncbi:MAG: hypothetical protein NC123_11445 [Butyrivibrio sp.]|nr:hypothetical protein [Acetatifactor muris]MCM1560138.1 hypothetical protein [Butyrivibrio sp.]